MPEMNKQHKSKVTIGLPITATKFKNLKLFTYSKKIYKKK